MTIYQTLLNIHSDWRWLVLLSGLAAVTLGLAGVTSQLPFVPLGRVASRLFVIAVDVELLLGLTLYAVSPLVRGAWMNMAAAMKHHETRFFAVEHGTYMIVGVAAMHVGAWRAKRAPDDGSKYATILGWYGGALVLFLCGVPWWRPLFRS